MAAIFWESVESYHAIFSDATDPFAAVVNAGLTISAGIGACPSLLLVVLVR